MSVDDRPGAVDAPRRIADIARDLYERKLSHDTNTPLAQVAAKVVNAAASDRR